MRAKRGSVSIIWQTKPSSERLALIRDHYEARVEGLEAQSFGAPPYRPVAPDAMFFAAREWKDALARRPVAYLTPFEQESDARGPVHSQGGRTGRTFAAERAGEGTNVFAAAIAHARGLQAQGKRVIAAAFTRWRSRAACHSVRRARFC